MSTVKGLAIVAALLFIVYLALPESAPIDAVELPKSIKPRTQRAPSAVISQASASATRAETALGKVPPAPAAPASKPSTGTEKMDKEALLKEAATYGVYPSDVLKEMTYEELVVAQKNFKTARAKRTAKLTEIEYDLSEDAAYDSLFCHASPNACGSNLRQRKDLRAYTARNKTKVTCIAKPDEPIIIQYMDSFGGMDFFDSLARKVNSNPNLCSTKCEIRFHNYPATDEAFRNQRAEQKDKKPSTKTGIEPRPADLFLYKDIANEGHFRGHRLDNQVLVLYTHEPRDLSLNTLLQSDFLLSFHPDSEVHVSYAWGLTELCDEKDPLDCMHRDIVPASSFEEKSFSGLFISNCGAGVRKNYLEELMQYIPLDSFGPCMHNKASPISGGKYFEKGKVLAKYKFNIAMENRVLNGYVTEKFYQPFGEPSILVYWGPPNAEDYAPAPNSFINVHDFPSPKQLATYLKMVSENNTLFESHQQWKKSNDLNPRFIDALRTNIINDTSSNYLCRLCEQYRTQYCS